MSSSSNNNIVLLGVIGLGAFFLMSRPGMANGLAPRPQQQGMNAAQWASAIAGGIGSLFKGNSGYVDANGTRLPDSFLSAINPKNPNFVGPPTAGNQPIPDWGSYVSGGSDGIAINPPNYDPYNYIA